jgi:hypothetical protein
MSNKRKPHPGSKTHPGLIIDLQSVNGQTRATLRMKANTQLKHRDLTEILGGLFKVNLQSMPEAEAQELFAGLFRAKEVITSPEDAE